MITIPATLALEHVGEPQGTATLAPSTEMMATAVQASQRTATSKILRRMACPCAQG